MEETLTLARVIENIRYVYGGRLLMAIFMLFLLEIIVLVLLKKKSPLLLPKFRMIVVFIAFVVSFVLVWKAKQYVAYDKFEFNSTACSSEYILEKKTYEEFDWADVNIYKYHYFRQYPDQLEKENFDTKFGADTEKPVFEESVLCEEGYRDFLLQIIACLSIYLTGMALLKTVFRDKYKVLSAFLSAPVGACIIVFLTVLIQILHIKYCHVSFLTTLILLWAGIIIYFKKKKILIDRTDIIIVLAALFFIVVSTYVKFYQFSGDSRWQLVLAMNLLDEGAFTPWTFAQATTFGFWGISLHSFALLFGIDFLYAFFPVLTISGMGIFFSTAMLFSKNKERGLLGFLVGFLILLLNFDFEYYSFSLLSNASMGILLLSIVTLTILSIEKKENVSLILALMSFALLTTRVEGVCYVVLFMVIPFDREGSLKLATILSGIEIVVWQIAQFIYSDGTGVDGWTPMTGLALSLVGALLILEPYLTKINFVKAISRHYKIIYTILLLVIIALGFCYDFDMAQDNVIVFLSHLSVSKYSNSLSLWSFLILMLPLAIENSLGDKKSILFVCLAYYLLVFGISIFRTGNPLNTGISDSFRRIICQMMLMSVWLISYYVGKSEREGTCE